MFQVELEFEDVGFCGGRKTGVPGEKPSEQGREPTTNSTHICWWGLSALTTAPSLLPENGGRITKECLQDEFPRGNPNVYFQHPYENIYILVQLFSIASCLIAYFLIVHLPVSWMFDSFTPR